MNPESKSPTATDRNPGKPTSDSSPKNSGKDFTRTRKPTSTICNWPTTRWKKSTPPVPRTSGSSRSYDWQKSLVSTLLLSTFETTPKPMTKLPPNSSKASASPTEKTSLPGARKNAANSSSANSATPAHFYRVMKSPEKKPTASWPTSVSLPPTFARKDPTDSASSSSA